MARLASVLLSVTMLSFLLTPAAPASARSPAPNAHSTVVPKIGAAAAPSEEEQARTIKTLTARVEVLERQAQTAVQAEQVAAHRAIMAINGLLTLVVVVGALFGFFGFSGIRDIRRMARHIHTTRDQTDQEVRSLPEVDITRQISPELTRTLADLGRRLDLLEEFGQPLEAGDCIARGNAWYAQGDYERAASWYSRAIIAEPALADAHYRKGIALRQLGKLQEALAALERVIQLDSSNPEPLYVKGIVLQELGQHQEAVAAYSKAIALSPQWARPHLNRAAAYARLGQTEQSLTDLERAIELGPESRDAAVASPDFDSLRDNDKYRKLTNQTAASAVPRPAGNPSRARLSDLPPA
jgi:tetratricopeptide (TPR) repeat protein